MATNILGVSAYYHDSAACLVRDGHIIAAAQEERFTRKKFDARFPTHAIRYCLQRSGTGQAESDGGVLLKSTTGKKGRVLAGIDYKDDVNQNK